MSINMQQIDSFIDTAINRLSSEQGTLISTFYINLRDYQSRITTKLVEDCIGKCKARGLQTERVGDGISVTVNLNLCVLNPSQANAYNTALLYTRTEHGNHR